MIQPITVTSPNRASGLLGRSHLIDGLERISSFTRKGRGCISMPNRADKTGIPVSTLSLFWLAASPARTRTYVVGSV
jgi:hypothetical protein